MNRRERRVWKKKTRRIGIVLASVAMLGASVGVTGIASADKSDSTHSCDSTTGGIGHAYWDTPAGDEANYNSAVSQYGYYC
jgi:hypothetical protein